MSAFPSFTSPQSYLPNPYYQRASQEALPLTASSPPPLTSNIILTPPSLQAQLTAVNKFLTANGLMPFVIDVKIRPAINPTPGLNLKATDGGIEIDVFDYASKGLVDHYIDYVSNVVVPTGFSPNIVRVNVRGARIMPKVLADYH